MRLPATLHHRQCWAPHLAFIALCLCMAAAHLAPHLVTLDAGWHLAWAAPMSAAAAGRAVMAAVTRRFFRRDMLVHGGIEKGSKHGYLGFCWIRTGWR